MVMEGGRLLFTAAGGGDWKFFVSKACRYNGVRLVISLVRGNFASGYVFARPLEPVCSGKVFRIFLVFTS